MKNIQINQSTMINFIQGDPHKVYMANIDVDFDGSIGADYLEHYNGIVDKNKKLILSFRTIPLYKVKNKSSEKILSIKE